MEFKKITIIAPGRVVLFGEHQDYLGLPVIPAAIDLYLKVEGKKSRTNRFFIDLIDFKANESFKSYPIKYVKKRDYLRSGVKVLQEEGIIPKDQGVTAKITSNIPMQAGLSSSSALNVAWIKFLSQLFKYQLNSLELTKYAHKAEVLEFNEPGGMQDHMVIAHGYVNFEEFSPIKCTRLLFDLPGIVIGNSLERKDTIYTLDLIKNKVKKGLEYYGVSSIKEISYDEINNLEFKIRDKNDFNKNSFNILKGMRLNYEITKIAYSELSKSQDKIDHCKVGNLMLKHHKHLRDYLNISTPKIERMITAAMNAGALGGKITGSGNGGCMIAYCPGKEKEVSQAIKRIGAEVHIAKVVSGVTSI